MLRAFAIVCLVVAIYAIVGTDFYGSIDPENFGSFFVTAYTLFEGAVRTCVDVGWNRVMVVSRIWLLTHKSPMLQR